MAGGKDALLKAVDDCTREMIEALQTLVRIPTVNPPGERYVEFVEQFENKSVRDPFQVGRDIAAVSRATITMNHAARVLRDSTRTMAKTFLTPDQIKP